MRSAQSSTARGSGSSGSSARSGGGASGIQCERQRQPLIRHTERVKKRSVAVLGATGTVGQRFISLLAAHPWFEVTVLTGSDRSVGQRFGDAVHWLLPTDI
ncbi:MAG: hypothetical protein HYY42_00775, partial [Chloroflexi bacterium]|nr:hypothetical protein [Chloroflexota bacterium]